MKTRRNNMYEAIRAGFVVVALAAIVFGQPKPDNKAALTNFEKAIDAGDTAAVESDLFRFVVANPRDARGFFLLAKMRFKQGRLPEAKSLLNKTLSIEPSMTTAKLTLARVDVQLGAVDEAREIVRGVPETDVAEPSLRLSAAETAALVGDCPSALKLADKLPPAIKNGKALPLRANCYLETGDAKSFAALSPLAKALVKQNPAAAVEFAAVLNKSSKHRETVDLLALVIAAAPQNADALLLSARSEIALKDFPKAKVHLAQAEKIRPDSSDLLYVKSLLESDQGNNARALELLEQSLRAKPDDVQALSRFVVVALRANENGKAFRASDRLVALEPNNLDYLYLQGISALQSNNLAKAETSLTKFLDARPADQLGCLALGLTFAAQPERIAEARGQLEKCLATNPGNFEAAYQLGLSYKVQGETEKAVEYLERTVRLSPNYAAALRDLGAVYLQSGKESDARPVLEKSATLAPNDAEVHFQLSRLYNLIGEPELARKHLELFQKLKDPKKDGM